MRLLFVGPVAVVVAVLMTVVVEVAVERKERKERKGEVGAVHLLRACVICAWQVEGVEVCFAYALAIA